MADKEKSVGNTPEENLDKESLDKQDTKDQQATEQVQGVEAAGSSTDTPADSPAESDAPTDTPVESDASAETGASAESEPPAEDSEDKTAKDAKPAAKSKAKPNIKKESIKEVSVDKQKTAPAIAGMSQEIKPVPLKAAPESSQFEKSEYRGDKRTDLSSLQETSVAAEEIAAPKVLKTPPKNEIFYATGRRKTSSARVYMQGGKGTVSINGNSMDEYFPFKKVQEEALRPLRRLEAGDMFNLKINVRGGGTEGQAGAIRHGLARALLKYDETLRSFLRKNGFLTRDPRSVERKKVGFHKARKSPQFSKR